MGNLDLMAVTLTYKVSNKDKIIGCKKQKVKKKLLLTLRTLQVDWELVTSSKQCISCGCAASDVQYSLTGGEGS